MKRRLDFRRGNVLAEGLEPSPEEVHGRPKTEIEAMVESILEENTQRPITADEPVSYQQARRFNGKVGNSMSGS